MDLNKLFHCFKSHKKVLIIQFSVRVSLAKLDLTHDFNFVFKLSVILLFKIGRKVVPKSSHSIDKSISEKCKVIHYPHNSAKG